MMHSVILLFYCLLLVAPALQAAESATEPSSTNALVGRLWSPEENRFLPPEALYQRLPPGGWLLIGEQHDNPDHHRIEAEIISTLGERQQLGAVALEMANSAQQPLLDQVLATRAAPTAEALDWSQGWPWALYEAPLQAAFRWATRVLGADLTREQMAIAHTSGAPQGELEPAHGDFMRTLLFDSHCGQLPRSQLDPMRQVQLARDQQIARVLRAAAIANRTGVLLTGSIHARLDLGVPRWLDQTPHLSLLLQAVDPALSAATEYRPATFGNLATVDLILFTPPQDTPDYCARFTHKSP